MAQVIAGMYEIREKIGAGGGGVVYLGWNQRLKKQVVLKADKRRLSASEEALRREVDMLKGLSHTYIPQVYDFVQEDGVVYTVIDFIEGESMDKLLARKQRPSQPQVIQWACQLLEALAYLHSRPPYGILHGDIKPANIMLRPQGDVCLIDFNIALALGEDGAVKVGFSRGYASPEHYGADYINSNRLAKADATMTDEASETMAEGDSDETVADSGGEERSRGKSVSVGKGSTQEKGGVKLDVRSDIYSLGATLYHLLSGSRPEQDARQVTPLGADVCSPAVAAIISKSMDPDPDLRYQTAEEMRNAFLALHKKDPRIVRHRRRTMTCAAILSAVFLAGGGCTFVGLKQMEQRQTALAMAEYSANALAEGNVSEAVNLALGAIPLEKSLLCAPVTAQAQKALTDALGVYDLSDGFKALDALELPAEPFGIAVSPRGTRFAATYAYETAVYAMEDGQRIAVLPIQNSALSDVVFVDENRIVYAGETGITAYDLDGQKELWSGEIATTLAVSGDGAIVAAVNRNEDHAVIYRMSDGVKLTECSFDGLYLSVAANDIFADPDNNLFALNEDGSLLAVSFYNGGLALLDWERPDESLIIYDESDYVRFGGGFFDGYFAFAAQRSGESQFGLIDVKEAAYAGGYSSQNGLLIQSDGRGIYLADGNLLVSLEVGRDGSLEEREMAYTGNVNINAFSIGDGYVMVATDDQCFSFYDAGANLASTEVCGENSDFVALAGGYAIAGNRNEPSLRVLKLERHEETQVLSYDARYSHEEARISGDGKSVMLFDYQGFCIYDIGGDLRTQVQMPDAGNIYDQQYRKGEDGSYLEVIWYDGTVRKYDGTDGSLLSEEAGEPPAKDLYEEFYTEQYRVASALHSAPEVYDLKTGKLIATLEKDAFLTYVTQMGDYLVTEYISASGERYGLLLDKDFQTLAYLPGLCDVNGDSFLFDYESGNLRQSRLYSLEELVELGEALIEK
ncbi:MAG: protein kinase [Candidatus Gastranaerophilales bacterium]|nr:protein kinase [Candidatus Gastranaerophilales bacterium]